MRAGCGLPIRPASSAPHPCCIQHTFGVSERLSQPAFRSSPYRQSPGVISCQSAGKSIFFFYITDRRYKTLSGRGCILTGPIRVLRHFRKASDPDLIAVHMPLFVGENMLCMGERADMQRLTAVLPGLSDSFFLTEPSRSRWETRTGRPEGLCGASAQQDPVVIADDENCALFDPARLFGRHDRKVFCPVLRLRRGSTAAGGIPRRQGHRRVCRSPPPGPSVPG